jgi:hypothetical protein
MTPRADLKAELRAAARAIEDAVSAGEACPLVARAARARIRRVARLVGAGIMLPVEAAYIAAEAQAFALRVEPLPGIPDD